MRSSRTRMSLAAGAAVFAAALTPAAAAAAPIGYPAGGSGFTSGPEGWTGSAASCAPASGLEATCTAATEHSPTEGNPPGSLNSRLDVLVNAGGLLQGRTTWTSPDFTLPAGTPIRSAALALDRRLDGGGLALNPQSTYTVTLIDRSAANKETAVLTDAIDQNVSAFARKGTAVPAGALAEGRQYAVRIDTTTTTRAARVGLLGSLNTRYDNVALTTDDAVPATGLQAIGDGAQGSPGVAVRSTPLSDAAAARLAASLNPYAEVGRGPGGSVVPLSRCTIVGTAANNRIKGTPGNDVICGLGGNDRIDGAGGNDIIDTANGNDIGQGGAGKDTLIGVRGKDRLSGGAAADRVGGGAGSDRLDGNTGNDRVHGGSANDRLAGSSGKDRLTGGKGGDRFAGGSGADRINAKDKRRDRIDGGSGRDLATVDRRARAKARPASKRAARKRADRVRRVERVR